VSVNLLPDLFAHHTYVEEGYYRKGRWSNYLDGIRRTTRFSSHFCELIPTTM